MRVAVAAAVALTPAGRRLVERVVGASGEHRPARVRRRWSSSAMVVATDLLLLPLVFWAGYVHDGGFGLRTQGVGGLGLRLGRVPPAGVARRRRCWSLLGYTGSRALAGDWAPVGGRRRPASLGVCVAFALAAGPRTAELPASRRWPPGPVRDRGRARARGGRRARRRDPGRGREPAVDRQNAYISGFGASRAGGAVRHADRRAHAGARSASCWPTSSPTSRNRDVLRFALLGAAGAVIAAYVVALRCCAGARAAGGSATPRIPRRRRGRC